MITFIGRRRFPRVAAGLVGCSLAAAVATAQKLVVESHRDERADFAAIRTYAWLPSPPARSDVAPDAYDDPNLTQQFVEPHIVAAVDRELSARGMNRISEGDPDVRVVYYAALTVGMDAQVL